MTADRRALTALYAAGALLTAAAFVPAAPTWPAALLPPIALALTALSGGGAALLSSIVATVALVWVEERGPGALPVSMAALVVAMWGCVALTGWHRRRAAAERRAAAHAREDDRVQAKTIQKEIDFYTGRARDLSERSASRRRLSSAAQELGALLDPGEIQERLAAVANTLFAGAAVAIWPGPSASAVATRSFESGQALLSAGGPGMPSEIVAPIRSGRAVVGVLHATAAPDRRAFSNEDLRLLETLASLATDALGNGALFQQVRQNALRDGLTGLLTHRAFQERFEAAVAEASRYRQPLSVILADVDHFKSVNDSHGHQSGDAVLQGIAHVMDRHVRDVDVLARYGGEEFVILLLDTDHASAIRIAEEIREDISDQVFDGDGRSLRVTASFGVSTFPADAPTAAALLRSADQHLYAAKRAGRNRVVGRGQ